MCKKTASKNQFIIPTDALNSFQSRNLFYPSSCSDLCIPIETFLPWINDFWFVDCRYDVKEALKETLNYELINQTMYPANGTTIRYGPTLIWQVQRIST